MKVVLMIIKTNFASRTLFQKVIQKNKKTVQKDKKGKKQKMVINCSYIYVCIYRSKENKFFGSGFAYERNAKYQRRRKILKNSNKADAGEINLRLFFKRFVYLRTSIATDCSSTKYHKLFL